MTGVVDTLNLGPVLHKLHQRRQSPVHYTYIHTHGDTKKLRHCELSDISQGSVETRLRCAEIFGDDFIRNLPFSRTAKVFGKFVNICKVRDESTAENA